MLKTITHNQAHAQEDDSDEEDSGRDTKLVMPVQHEVPKGVKIIGDYKLDKTLG
jgi:hypothetical protein